MSRGRFAICSDKSHYEELPKGWAVAPINDLFIINPRNNVDDGLDVAFVPMTLIEDGFSNRFTYQERKWGEIKSGFTHFADGDVGIAKITPCLENRKSAVFSNLKNGIGAGTTELHIFRTINRTAILPEYLLWFFKSETLIESCIEAFSGAVGQQRVSKDHIANTLLPVPPFKEQLRIVETIETAFFFINEIEASKSDLLSAITTAKQKILSLAISGKLVPQDPNDEPASVLLDRIRTEREKISKVGKVKKSAPAFKTADTFHYGQLPLGYVCHLINTAEINAGTLPYLDVKFLRGKPEAEYKLSGRFVESGTPLVDGENSGEVFTATETGYMGSTFRELLVNPAYDYNFVLLAIKLYQKDLRENKTGSAIPHLNKKLFAELPLPLIPLAIQKQIVKLVDNYFTILDSVANNLN